MANKQGKRPNGDRTPDDNIAEELGPTHVFWQEFQTHTKQTFPGVSFTWKWYKSEGSWRLIAQFKSRNLAYLRPDSGSFLVSLALSDEALDAAEKLGVSSKVLGPIRCSPKFPEGRAVRVQVQSKKDLRIALNFVTAKGHSL